MQLNATECNANLRNCRSAQGFEPRPENIVARHPSIQPTCNVVQHAATEMKKTEGQAAAPLRTDAKPTRGGGSQKHNGKRKLDCDKTKRDVTRNRGKYPEHLVVRLATKTQTRLPNEANSAHCCSVQPQNESQKFQAHATGPKSLPAEPTTHKPSPQLAFLPNRGTIVLGVSNLSSGRKPTFLLL